MDLTAFLALDAEARAAHLSSLTADELAAFTTDLAAHIEQVAADETATVADLTAAADARDTLTAEQSTRDTAAAAEQAERDAARARLTPPVEPEVVEETAEPVAEVEPEAVVEEVREPVAASVTVTVPTPAKPAPLAAVAASAPAPVARKAAPVKPRGALVAAAGNDKVQAGQSLTRDQLVDTMTDNVNGLLRAGSLRDGVERGGIVASLKADYAPERTLSMNDSAEQTAAKMEAFAREAAKPQALTASGGLCAPTAVDYSLLTLSSDDRPVRDGLPQVGVTRGGIRFVPPRRLADITSGVDQYTVANDALATPVPKSRLRLACLPAEEVLLYAVTERIVFGNLNARAFPEQIEQDLAELGSAHARKAEKLLLDAMKAKSKSITSAAILGYSRDLLAQVDTSAAYLRDQHRISDSAVLEVFIPRHARAAMRADLTRQLATDMGGMPMAVTDAQLTEHFTRRNIEVTWTYETTATASGAAFGVQAGGTAALDTPDTIEFGLFPKGSFQYLDGGEIAMGVVRDSTLNNTNDYEMFGESFEAVAFRGVESLWLTGTYEPNGASAGTVNTTGAARTTAVDA